MIQSPISNTNVTTQTAASLQTETNFRVVGINSFFPEDYIQIDDEYMQVISAYQDPDDGLYYMEVVRYVEISFGHTPLDQLLPKLLVIITLQTIQSTSLPHLRVRTHSVQQLVVLIMLIGLVLPLTLLSKVEYSTEHRLPMRQMRTMLRTLYLMTSHLTSLASQVSLF